MNISFRPQFAATCMNKEELNPKGYLKLIVDDLEKTPKTKNVRFWLKPSGENFDTVFFRLTVDKFVKNEIVGLSCMTYRCQSLFDVGIPDTYKGYLQEAQKAPTKGAKKSL